MYITVLIDRRRYVPPIVSPVSTLCSVSDTWRRSPQYDYNMSKMLRYGYAADVAGSGRVFDSEANRLRQEAEAQTLRSASVSVVGFQGLHQFPRSWHLERPSEEDEEVEQSIMLREVHSLVEPIRTASAS